MKWKSVFPHVQKNKKKKWKALSAVLAAVLCMTAAAPAAELHAEEGPAGYVRSVYTNEWVPAAQAASRPIAIMMPTDKAAQPSYGISHAKVLYEIMEEGDISRQLAVIDDWQGLSRIGNIRSCRAYYIPIATEWDRSAVSDVPAETVSEGTASSIAAVADPEDVISETVRPSKGPSI